MATDQRKPRKRDPGIRVRHGSTCPASVDASARCNCTPRYQARVWSTKDGREKVKVFRSAAEARNWRDDTRRAIRLGTVQAVSGDTLNAAAEALLEGMEDGAIQNSSGERYKPSVIRSYRGSLNEHILPTLGQKRLGAIDRADVQKLVEKLNRKTRHQAGCPARLKAPGECTCTPTQLDASTVRNALMPLRVIYRRAIRDGIVAVSPVETVELRRVTGKRDRMATPERAAQLIGELDGWLAVLWATAFYAGLRLGELRALRWRAVRTGAGEIHIVDSWDPEAGRIDPKSDAGVRTVPIPAVLRDALAEHRAATSAGDGDLVFGRTPTNPFTTTHAYDLARTAWATAGIDETYTLHEARHTYASLMAAAGVRIEDLSEYMGHSSLEVTIKRYRHLYPEARKTAASALDSLIERADTVIRLRAFGDADRS